MQNLSNDYLSRAAFWLMMATLLYFGMNGAQIFETALFVPRWASAPPASFQLLREVNLKLFWIAAHSIHEVVFIVALTLCWRIPFARKWLLILLVLHFAVRAWTLAYFAPGIIEFQSMAADSNVNSGLVDRVSRWQNLNYLRVALFVLISAALVLLHQQILKLKIRN